MTEQELKEIDKAILAKLPSDLDDLFAKLRPSVNAKMKKVSVDDNFVNVEMLVDLPNSTRIANITLTLDRYTLYSASCCTKLDIGGSIDSYALTPAVFAELRVLRVAFKVCKDIYRNNIGSLDAYDNIKVAFDGKSGELWYYGSMTHK